VLGVFQEHFFSSADQSSWRKYLPEGRSVFGSLGYARICETYRNFSPRLYVLESGNAIICYPLFLRPLADLPFNSASSGKWDSGTPDFTGPLMYGSDCRLASVFPAHRDALFQTEGIVAEFAHLHPWSNAVTVLADGSAYNRDIVWVDVSLSPEKLWRDQFEHCCRKNINRAEREGVRVFAAAGDEYVREFHRIYVGTMDRRNALAGYYFSYKFFKAFIEELPANSRFVFAEYRNQVVAATLYLYDDQDVFSFLGGTDVAFQHVRPTNAVIWQTIRWAHETGKKRLILGGGYSPGDNIFRFKSTFSRLLRPFHVYKKIHLEQDYAALEQRCREYGSLNGQSINYFPSYRFLPTQPKPVV